MEPDDLAAVRRIFRSGEMGLLAGSAMGRELAPETFAKRVRADMNSGEPFDLMITKFDINPDALLRKLDRLTPDQMEALLTTLRRWQALPLEESMGANSLPSICTLQRLGLVETLKGPVCWGVLYCRDGERVHENLVYHPEKIPATETEPVEDIAFDLVDEYRHGEPGNAHALSTYAYRIHRATGWRRVLVVVDRGKVRVKEIPVAHLLESIYEGDLKDVVIEGVNAPYQVRPGIEF
jgi:hypothetical protein